MTEPRMRARQKGQQFSTNDLTAFLVAFGDDHNPLPETIRVLDEIITDFIIETAHAAALTATTSHRAKIKVDDFKFALRKDPKKLGRVTELLAMDKDIKRKRRAFEVEDEVVAREGKRGRRAGSPHAPPAAGGEEGSAVAPAAGGAAGAGVSGAGPGRPKGRGPGRPPKDRSERAAG